MLNPDPARDSQRRTPGFSSFSILSKYSFHLPMIMSRSLKTTQFSLCIRFIWVKCLVALSRAFAILDIFLSPSGVSNSSYNLFIASTLAFGTAFFSALFACLFLHVSSCLRDVSHIFVCLFLILHHILALIIPRPCILISWGPPPSCHTRHPLSYSQYRCACLILQFLHNLHMSYFNQHLIPELYFKINFSTTLSSGLGISHHRRDLFKTA